jgi:hypothetical protein
MNFVDAAFDLKMFKFILSYLRLGNRYLCIEVDVLKKGQGFYSSGGNLARLNRVAR